MRLTPERRVDLVHQFAKHLDGLDRARVFYRKQVVKHLNALGTGYDLAKRTGERQADVYNVLKGKSWSGPMVKRLVKKLRKGRK